MHLCTVKNWVLSCSPLCWGVTFTLLRVVRTNNCADQKYAKSCCHKTIILMTPIHLLEASGAPALQEGWITVHKRQFFLKERLSACGLPFRIHTSSPRACTLHPCTVEPSLYQTPLGTNPYSEVSLTQGLPVYSGRRGSV